MPTIRELRAIEKRFNEKHAHYLQVVSTLPLASATMLDADFTSTIIAEGVFLKYFTLWESSVEEAFLHFCLGGKTFTKTKPTCRLANCSSVEARKILTGNSRFLDWSNGGYIRERAVLVFANGFPFYNPIIGTSHLLADTERIRNLIAHNSVEAWTAYLAVQRNCFVTERTFNMPAGHLLRVRRANTNENWGSFYFKETAKIFAAILNG